MKKTRVQRSGRILSAGLICAGAIFECVGQMRQVH